MSSHKAEAVGMGILRKIGNLLMGLVAVCTVVGLFWQTDPFSFLAAVIFLSICMFGLPIIILVVVSYFVGAAINSFIFNKNGQKDGQPNNEQLILADYIRSARKNNLTREDITKKLIETGGWSAAEIEIAFDLLDATEETIKE